MVDLQKDADYSKKFQAVMLKMETTMPACFDATDKLNRKDKDAVCEAMDAILEGCELATKFALELCEENAELKKKLAAYQEAENYKQAVDVNPDDKDDDSGI